MALRTGSQYLAALRDGRTVIHDGRAVDVSEAPGFAATAATVAQFYDFQNLASMAEIMSYTSEDGERVGMAFIEPRSREDLRRRAAAYAAWAEVSCGLMARSPDYMSTCLAALGGISRVFEGVDPVLAARARKIYIDARTRDLCYTHTFSEPFKVLPPASEGSEPAPSCRVVRETADGLVISGARALATLAPFSDMNFDLPGGALCVREGQPWLAGFVMPSSAPGLRWICRDTLGGSGREASLSSRCDEMDCVALFDECLIPWEQVYLLVPADTPFPAMPLVMAGLQHHVVVRCVAKTRLFVGLAHLIAESSRVGQFVNVRAKIGEMIGFLNTMEAFAMAAIEGAIEDPETGHCVPHPASVEAGVTMYSEFHGKMVHHLLDLGGSRYMSTPQAATLDLLGGLVEDHFRGRAESGRDNVALFRLAWDLVGSGWGSRHNLYERFHFGDATLRKSAAYLHHDMDGAVGMVRRLLKLPAAGGFSTGAEG
ncbi:4-hydroxyphenylacetate 3-monooxygenase oxygenase component [Enhygromyxa salina]|uniref:4-hydroxyphenylacetate 3-monooxygenase oxygenase component n=1 Tax=Enhygromyxa salina TaxID=215803 RepID=A0A2S9XX31_9BACT|nr:4-hydroxyphenylacetate 3-hydroxylase N-terminal domain-containing protein [Enhygromyxa salina]PRP97394.1 4-hydroxyphenylacetate 3-monooxygenase oxygenase component [Enhygromyxa salina]